jgi:hypothetical protein
MYKILKETLLTMVFTALSFSVYGYSWVSGNIKLPQNELSIYAASKEFSFINTSVSTEIYFGYTEGICSLPLPFMVFNNSFFDQNQSNPYFHGFFVIDNEYSVSFKGFLKKSVNEVTKKEINILVFKDIFGDLIQFESKFEKGKYMDIYLMNKKSVFINSSIVLSGSGFAINSAKSSCKSNILK